MTQRDQEQYTAARLQLEAKDKLIYDLRQQLERAERAAGRMASELQEARELAILSDSFESAFRIALQRIASVVGMDNVNSMNSGQLATDVVDAVRAQMDAAIADADAAGDWRDRALKAESERAEAAQRLESTRVEVLDHEDRQSKLWSMSKEMRGVIECGPQTHDYKSAMRHLLADYADILTPPIDGGEPSVGDVAAAPLVDRQAYRVGSRVRFMAGEREYVGDVELIDYDGVLRINAGPAMGSFFVKPDAVLLKGAR